MSQPQSPPPGLSPSPDSPPDLAKMMGASTNQQKTSRPIGNVPQEGKYVAEDVAQGILQLLPDFMQDILHMKPTDTPDEKAKKQKMLQNFSQLSAEQQQVVQKKMQEENEKRKKEEEEKMVKRQEDEKKAAENALPEPKGKISGAAAGMPGASRKKSVIDDLNQKRQQLSSAG